MIILVIKKIYLKWILKLKLFNNYYFIYVFQYKKVKYKKTTEKKNNILQPLKLNN